MSFVASRLPIEVFRRSAPARQLLNGSNLLGRRDRRNGQETALIVGKPFASCDVLASGVMLSIFTARLAAVVSTPSSLAAALIPPVGRPP